MFVYVCMLVYVFMFCVYACFVCMHVFYVCKCCLYHCLYLYMYVLYILCMYECMCCVFVFMCVCVCVWLRPSSFLCTNFILKSVCYLKLHSSNLLRSVQRESVVVPTPTQLNIAKHNLTTKGYLGILHSEKGKISGFFF